MPGGLQCVLAIALAATCGARHPQAAFNGRTRAAGDRAAAPVSTDAAVPAASGWQSSASAQTDRIFAGKPVSLEFEGADLRAVLRVFAEISGLNIVIDPAARGTVDVSMRDVPWDQALDVILRANKLGYVLDGTIVRVAPIAALADEEKGRRKLAEEQALAGELRISTRALNYARADDMARLLTKSALTSREPCRSTRVPILSCSRTCSPPSTGACDRRGARRPPATGRDRGAHRADVARLRASDRRPVGLRGRVASDLGNTPPLAFPNSGSITGRTGAHRDLRQRPPPLISGSRPPPMPSAWPSGQ